MNYKTRIYLCVLTLILAMLGSMLNAEEVTKLRVIAYNVACGQWVTPERLAEELKPLNPDILLLSEVPKANRGEKGVKDWSQRLGEAIGLKHVHVGTVSSANHKAPDWGDMTGKYGGKFKSILSRTPLTEPEEYLVEGSGWKRASAVRVETEINGKKYALYSLHLPGFAHNKRQPTDPEKWQGSKHRQLADHINAEDPSYGIIVGGDFNEFTDGLVMQSLAKATQLKNVVAEESIDHILYSPARTGELIDSKRDWGPKNQNADNKKADGCLSDHPWIYAEFALTPASVSSETSSLKVMSYNIHRGGIVCQKQPLSQTAKVIQKAEAGIVGIQETRSPTGDTAAELAELLGWNFSIGKRHRCIMTRYEITEEFTDGVKVMLPTGQAAYVFNLHLPSHPYQPYQLLNIRPSWHKHTNDIVFIKTEAEAIEWAQKTRGDLIEALFKQIDSISDKEAPVFVVGDFNEPSHLDWTEAAAQAGRHPIKVAYPASQALAQAGFTDAYRALYPDEMTHPGLTWTPTKTADDPTTHLDRIDFVYSKGVSPKAVQIVGEKGENANIVISPYPSDHRAIVATYDLP